MSLTDKITKCLSDAVKNREAAGISVLIRRHNDDLCFASAGVSAFVRTLSFLYWSAQSMMRPNSPAMTASTVGIAPSYTYPVEPSKEMISPS